MAINYQMSLMILIVALPIIEVAATSVPVAPLPAWIKAAVEIPACVAHARSLLFDYVNCADKFEHDLTYTLSSPVASSFPKVAVECCLQSKFITCFRGKASDLCGQSVANKLTSTLLSNLTSCPVKYSMTSLVCSNIINGERDVDLVLILFICFGIAFFSSILMVTAYFLCLKCGEKYTNLDKVILVPIGFSGVGPKKHLYEEI